LKKGRKPMNPETSSMKIGKLLVAYGAVDLVTGGMLLTEAMPVHRPVIGQQAFSLVRYSVPVPQVSYLHRTGVM
jgi:hypothetical protein